MATPLVGRDRQLTHIERHLAGPGQAVVIHGSEGVGKTRLARDVLTRMEHRSCTTMSLLGTPAAATIPFAAVAGLIPASQSGAADAAQMVRVCREHLSQETVTTPLVVLIDDAHWLDPGSLSLLHHLVDLPRVHLVLTVRSDAPPLSEITGLWKDELALRVDLQPLDRAGTEQLIELTVGAPAHPATGETLWDLSRGNPLFLRELLLSAGELDTTVAPPAMWELSDPPTVTPRLADLVASRLQGLDADARSGLEALTLIEPLGLDPFRRLLGAETIEQLEVAETIEITQEGRRREVRFGHPVYGEVVRATTTHSRLANVANRLLDTLPDQQARLTDRAVLANLWSLAGRPGRPELFTEAARQALSASDHATAEDLARSAVDRGGGFEAGLTYGEALVYRGKPDLADQVLASTASQAVDDEQIARVALLRAHSELFNRGDPARADEVVVEAGHHVTDRDWLDQLDATRALAAALRGDLPGALAASEAVRHREAPAPQVLLGVLTVSTVAHTLLGDLNAARSDIRRAAPLLEPLREALPLASDQIGMIEVGTDLYDGRVSDAIALADKGYALAVDGGMPGQVGSWAVTLAMALIAAGRFADAVRITDVAAAKLATADPLGLRGSALSLHVLCEAALRDLGSAAALHEQLAAAGDHDLRTRIHAGRAEVWLTAASGDLQRASALAVEHGRRAVEAKHHVWGALTLHDAVRFGYPSLVRDDLTALSAAHDAGLLRLFADHAAALDDQDPDALRDVATRFSSGGAQLYAGEAMAQAADILHRLGQRRAGDAAATVASDLVARCGDVVTPAILRAKDPLTAREREIAIMARQGRSSREIAAALVLSPRTVDNHLAAVYRKTGIEGRHQLDDLVFGEGSPAT